MATWKDTGALASISGGTGYTTYAGGDLLYGTGETGPNGLARLPVQVAGYLLGSDGSAPAWVRNLDLQTATATARSLIGQGVSTGVSHFLDTTPVSGPHFGFVAQITGTVAAGTASYKVAGYFAAESAGRGDDVIAVNAVAQWTAAHPASNVVGLEINVNNNNSDLTLNQTPYVGGLLVASGGTKHPGRAILLGATSAANTWRKGIDIPASAVSDTGIEVGTPTAGLVGSVLVKQLANAGDTLLLQRNTDTSPTGTLIRCVNGANSAELFKVSVNGKLDVGASGPVSIAGDVIAVFRNASATGYGVAVYGGSSASNYALLVVDGAVANNLFEVAGDGGVKVGSPTGGTGGSMGLGKLNVAGDVFRNGTAYTHPDYVFEHWATGQIVRFAKNEGAATYRGLLPLPALERHVRTHFRFPLIDGRACGGFKRSDIALALIEETTIYLFGHEKRIARLERRLRKLEAAR